MTHAHDRVYLINQIFKEIDDLIIQHLADSNEDKLHDKDIEQFYAEFVECWDRWKK